MTANKLVSYVDEFLQGWSRARMVHDSQMMAKSKMDPFMVEILATHEALSWLWSCYMDDIIVEIDSQRLRQPLSFGAIDVSTSGILLLD
ncbi:hypothetical protein Gohar_007293 [Gossypium harknessii]|uniref:RNase H type-1 domain-containing protein n=1 Tax=Gossypium harknessii TaxID=34285 RepID=A0A7J9GG35_9ROSI|nr:hypothetical protein [Gossypium harknessii]